MRKVYHLVSAALLFAVISGVAEAGQGEVRGVTLSRSEVEAGAAVAATVTGTSPCGAVHIDWGDGTAVTHATSTLPITREHAYKSAGTFTVRAQGMGNCTGEATARMVVKGPPATLTGMKLSETSVAPRTPVEIALEGTGACTVTMNFGDGTTGDVGGTLPSTLRHTYTAQGRYTIVATAAPPCSGRRTAVVEVRPRENRDDVRPRENREITGISVDVPSGPSRSMRAITVQGSGTCSYVLDFGDGNQDTRDARLPDVVRHNYPAAGRYTVVATARPPCEGTQRWTFDVANGPDERGGRLRGVSVRPEVAAVGQDVTIDVTGTGTCRFVVDFHDGESRTLTERLPHRFTYRYTRPGDYTIVVWSHDPCVGEGDATVSVRRRR